MVKKERETPYQISEARPVIVKGVWKFYFEYYTKSGNRKQSYQSTKIKIGPKEQRAIKEGRSPKVPDEVEALREKLVAPLVDEANLDLFGGAVSADSFFVWVDKYREERLKSNTLSATTKKGDESRYKGIKEHKPFDKPIAKITSADIKGFLDGLIQKGLSGNTVQQFKLIIDGVFKMAEDEEVIFKNPTKKIRSYRPKAMHKVTSDEVIKPDQFYDFLDAIKGEYIYPCILFAACTGLRRSECLGLRWDKVHVPGIMGCGEIPGMENGYIEVTQKVINIGPGEKPDKAESIGNKIEYFRVEQGLKNNSSIRTVAIVDAQMKERIVELFNEQQKMRKVCAESWNLKWGGTPAANNVNTEENQKLLKIWETGKPDYGYVCVNPVGELITPGQVEDFWKTLKKKYPQYLENVSFHGLRHSYATYLIHNQAPIMAVSKMMGHSSVVVTDNFYVHADTAAYYKAIKDNAPKQSSLEDYEGFEDKIPDIPFF